MKKQSVTKRNTFLELFAAVLLRPATIRIGLSGVGSTVHYVVVIKNREGAYIPLAQGAGIPLLLRLFTPCTVCTDLGMVPVHLFSDVTGGNDPDAWIDAHEEEILPVGFSVGQIVHESVVSAVTIISASVAVKARDSLLEELNTLVTPMALYPPLWGLAAAYREVGDQPVIIWKIDKQGSVLGVANRGYITGMCNFWADSDDVVNDTTAVERAVLPLLRSLCGEKRTAGCSVLVWSPVKEWRMPVMPALHPFTLEKPPVMGNVDVAHHEAFGNACCGEQLNFIPFLPYQLARRMYRSWQRTLQLLQGSITVLLISLVAMGIVLAGGTLIRHATEQKTVAVEQAYRALEQLRHERDSLLAVGKKRVSTVHESTLTPLVSNLQLVFPEGTRAEEITVVERDATSWQIALQVYATSSSLIDPLVKNLQAISGVSDVRLVYSERIAEKQKERGIFCRVVALLAVDDNHGLRERYYGTTNRK